VIRVAHQWIRRGKNPTETQFYLLFTAIRTMAELSIPLWHLCPLCLLRVSVNVRARRIIFQESAASKYFGQEKYDKNPFKKGDRATPITARTAGLRAKSGTTTRCFLLGKSGVGAAIPILIGAGIANRFPRARPYSRRKNALCSTSIDIAPARNPGGSSASKKNQLRQKSEFT